MESSQRASQLASKLDWTLLSPTFTAEQIKNLCSQAAAWNVAAVCVPPSAIAYAANILAEHESSTIVCSVVGFPLGYAHPQSKVHEARVAIQSGAKELDFVINQSWVKDKQWEWIKAELSECSQLCQRYNVVSKLIVETCNLSDDEKRKCCQLVVSSKIDYIKTSTGFAKLGAQVSDVVLFREFLAGKAKIKASGGIKTKSDALAMLEAGASRLGVSQALNILKENDS